MMVVSVSVYVCGEDDVTVSLVGQVTSSYDLIDKALVQ